MTATTVGPETTVYITTKEREAYKRIWTLHQCRFVVRGLYGDGEPHEDYTSHFPCFPSVCHDTRMCTLMICSSNDDEEEEEEEENDKESNKRRKGASMS